MERINTASRAVDLFGAGKHGFKNGNIAQGVAPTEFNAQWCNGLQEECANLIEWAGLALNAQDNAQLKQALIEALRKQLASAYTSSGAAPSFVLTPSPALASLTAGLRLRVKFHAAGNGTNDTLNVSGLGAKGIKQYDESGAKVAAVIKADQLADLEWDGADFVALNPLPAAFTNSKSANGYQKLPGGLILQWGKGSTRASDGKATINFPVAFSRSCFSVQVIHVGGGPAIAALVGDPDATSFAVGLASSFSNGAFTAQAYGFYWQAIGY